MNEQVRAARKMAAVERCGPTSHDADVASAQVDCCASPSLLFSLQFYVDHVVHSSSPSAGRNREDGIDGTLLLGFQLLQYEIVVFDEPLQGSEHDEISAQHVEGSRAAADRVMRVQHGKSCLFEADPAEFARELQSDRDAPLALLLMTQEHGRARLLAFAGVPLSLHLGILLDSGCDTLSSSMRHQVCEWASHSGAWELRDHCDRAMGSVVGAVTLSCLGKTLAPHLAHALGIQVSKSQPSSASSSRVQSPMDSETKEQSRRQADAVEKEDAKDQGQEAGAQAPAESARGGSLEAVEPAAVTVAGEQRVQVAMLDSGVQCDEEDVLLGATGAAFASLSMRHGDSGIRLDRAKRRTRGHRVKALEQYKTDSGGSSNRASQRGDGQPSQVRPKAQVHSASSGELLFPRDLPPPLFFQKATKKKA